MNNINYETKNQLKLYNLNLPVMMKIASNYPRPKSLRGLLASLSIFMLGIFFAQNINAQCTGTITSLGNVTCNGANNGYASIVGSGGTAPYTFSWSSAATGSTVTNLAAGSYTITLYDAVGCTKFLPAAVIITEPALLAFPTTTTPSVLNCSNSAVALVAPATGGTATYSYNWNTGFNAGPTLIVSTPGTYSVTVTDGSGCTASTNFVVIQTPNLSVATSVSNVTCNGGIDGSVVTSVTGGSAPYSYVWNPGNLTSSVISAVSVGFYTVTVSDANGCTQVATTVITQPTPIIVTSSNLVFPSCNGTDGSLKASATGGTNNYTFAYGILGTTSLWQTGATGKYETLYGLKAGNWKVVAYDNNGCQDSTSVLLPDSCDLVWPGDANRDLVADNNDILALGTAYGSTGSIRTSASINWIGQPASDWSQVFGNSKNYKNGDCNGDGTIDGNDTVAILQNYGLTHNLKIAKPPYVQGLPDLTFNIPTDTALSGSSIKVPIILGTSANPANNISGIAFSINYDPKIVDTTSISLSLNTTWLGVNGTDLIYITKNFGSMGRLDVGITRIDHKNVSGSGQIGELNFYMREDIAGKISGTLMKTLTLETSLIKAISKDETIIPINVGKDSIVTVQKAPLGISSYASSKTMRVYPNPTAGVLNVDLSGNETKEVKLVNIIGEVIWIQTSITENKLSIGTAELPAGTYYLSITTAKEKMVERVQVIK